MKRAKRDLFHTAEKVALLLKYSASEFLQSNWSFETAALGMLHTSFLMLWEFLLDASSVVMRFTNAEECTHTTNHDLMLQEEC